METVDFKLDGDFIELCNLLKVVGLADSGGHGKAMVAQGKVVVDGLLESRKTAKIRAGQEVCCGSLRILITRY